MEIKMQPTVDIQEVCEEFCCRICDFAFAEMSENGVYEFFGTDVDALIDLKESIAIVSKSSNEYYKRRLHRLQTDLRLLEKLRDMGYTEGVLICVWWQSIGKNWKSARRKGIWQQLK